MGTCTFRLAISVTGFHGGLPGTCRHAGGTLGGGSITTARKELHHRMGTLRKALLGPVKSQLLKGLSPFGDNLPPNWTDGAKTAAGIKLEGPYVATNVRQNATQSPLLLITYHEHSPVLVLTVPDRSPLVVQGTGFAKWRGSCQGPFPVVGGC